MDRTRGHPSARAGGAASIRPASPPSANQPLPSHQDIPKTHRHRLRPPHRVSGLQMVDCHWRIPRQFGRWIPSRLDGKHEDIEEMMNPNEFGLDPSLILVDEATDVLMLRPRPIARSGGHPMPQARSKRSHLPKWQAGMSEGGLVKRTHRRQTGSGSGGETTILSPNEPTGAGSSPENSTNEPTGARPSPESRKTKPRLCGSQ